MGLFLQKKYDSVHGLKLEIRNLQLNSFSIISLIPPISIDSSSIII